MTALPQAPALAPATMSRPAPGLRGDLAVLGRRRMAGLTGGITVATLNSPVTADPLSRSGIVRDDIRRGFGTASGVARGVPLTVRLRLTSANSGRPATGHAVYLWQCDQAGRYSLYSDDLPGENYLRGVQAVDEAGWVTFTSIFPGAHEGRWPRLHVEIYRDLTSATRGTGSLRTSQLVLPGDACARVYAAGGYAESTSALVTEEDGPLEMPSVTGDVRRGFVATRTLSV